MSYLRSRELGIGMLESMIRAIPGRRFGLLGYSQGGAIVSLVGRELVGGRLRDRHGDCRWLHAIGSPHRGLGRSFPGGDKLIPGQGVSGVNITATGDIDWWDFCLAGDVYGDADLDGTYLEYVYDAAGAGSLTDSVNMIAAGATSFGRYAEAAIMRDGPVASTRKIQRTAAVLARFAREFPHDKYGVIAIDGHRTALQLSADQLNRAARR
jgi:hypothetical protein